MHGVGLADEWPVIVNRSDWDTRGYDGILEEGMVLSVESYVGATGGVDGIKLEECALVTRDGCQLLSTFPARNAVGSNGPGTRVNAAGPPQGTRPWGGAQRPSGDSRHAVSSSAPRSIPCARRRDRASRLPSQPLAHRAREPRSGRDRAVQPDQYPVQRCDARNMQVYGLAQSVSLRRA